MLTRAGKKSSLTSFTARESGSRMHQKRWQGIRRHSSRLSGRKDDWCIVLEVNLYESFVCHLLLPCVCSLKYHRLHPEYIPTRIEKLGTSYNLRILLILCDIVRYFMSLLFSSNWSFPVRTSRSNTWTHKGTVRILEVVTAETTPGMFNK